MKKMAGKKWLILLVGSFVLMAAEPRVMASSSPDTSIAGCRLDGFKKDSLSETEKASILLMREEEKLARDVYRFLYRKWGSRVFENISFAEQHHMDAMLTLLQRYGIKDPVGADSPGIFQSRDLQKLYGQLTSQGQESALDAFKSGATIEDLDIYDLKRIRSEVDNEDILFVYGNLERASRNHLRAFNRNIESSNAVYTPKYLSEDIFKEIVSGEMERGNNAQGRGNGSRGHGKAQQGGPGCCGNGAGCKM